MKILLKDIGAILGLRKTGKAYSEGVERAVSAGETVIIDFDGVESVSSSFADELIAKLYVSYGREKFTSHIKFENINSDFIKKVINSAIRDRLGQGT